MRFFLTALIICLPLAIAYAAPVNPSPPASRLIELKASDGTLLKATFFEAAKPAPAVLLLHQSNRSRKSWDALAVRLAESGISALTLDMRGMGDSGGARGDFGRRSDDVDMALEYLRSQPGVRPGVIGVGGAGWLGVTHAVEAARRHPETVKSLVLISGETLRPGLQFLHQTRQLPQLYIYSDEDEYPPTQQAMQLLYAASSSSSKKLIHYPAAREAPWVWYETADAGKVAAAGGHGTDLFEAHAELPGIIGDWFASTLIASPGHAAADPMAAAQILNDVEFSNGIARARHQLTEARKQDPDAQLWPEISMSIIAQDFLREKDAKTAIEVFKLNLLAYPNSADVANNLADAYLADGQQKIAHEYARQSLKLLDTPGLPASTWVNTEPYRAEIRRDDEGVLKK